MDAGCLEVVVNRKPNTLIKAICYGAGVLAVCFCLLSFIFSSLLLIPAVLCAAAAYFAWLECVVDFEYVYVDKELRVAKIQQKQRRKELAVYDLTKMEILAPIDSHHLDAYKSKERKVLDYSSQGEENKPYRYVLILSDGTELILDMVGEYGAQILDIIRMFSPRNVFRN
jgi:hypothetical protein